MHRVFPTGRPAETRSRPWRFAATGWLLSLTCLVFASGAGPAESGTVGGLDLEVVRQRAERLLNQALAWYERTPPLDRVTWGGLGAAALLGVFVLLERLLRVRRRRVVPADFSSRFLERLHDGRLDRGKAQDFCELNPSPAARVALAAVKRWGRPVADLERATNMAQRVECDRLRRNVGTLRRVAALSPLIGLLGGLLMIGRALSTLGPNASPADWGPVLAMALAPLTAGVALATLALVAYDGLVTRVESIAAALERVATETIDAIALAAPVDPRPVVLGQVHPASPPPGPHAPSRSSHPIRMEIPRPKSMPSPRIPIDDDDYE